MNRQLSNLKSFIFSGYRNSKSIPLETMLYKQRNFFSKKKNDLNLVGGEKETKEARQPVHK